MGHGTFVKRSAGYDRAKIWGVCTSAFFAASFGLASPAEAGKLLTASGDWSLYRVPSYELAVGNGERVNVDGACVTEAVADGVRVDFVTLIPAENPGLEPYFGGVILQMTSSNWSFPPKQENLSLVSGSLTLSVAGSLFDFDTVNFNLGGHGNPPVALRVFIHMAMEPIEIVDAAGVQIVKFPSEGLLETFDEMLNCGVV